MLVIYILQSCLLIFVHLSNAVADPIGTGGPATVSEGEDALLTCVVMGPYKNDTVIWRKGPTEILSAGLNRVTNDKRISILHDEAPLGKEGKQTVGGDVWVLLIRNIKGSDTDVYTCEVNSEPVIKSFHPLRVKSKNPKKVPSSLDKGDKNNSTDNTELLPPLIDSESEFHSFAPTITHDFTDCCGSLNVSAKCMGFCTVHNILDGTTGIEPESCEMDFPNIIKCMADGRNHQPCCERRKIPDLCQDMCRGEYTPFTDYLKSRISCSAHTIPGLECILEGIQKIPSQPRAIFVEPLTEKSLQISWTLPENLPETVKNYKINVTVLHSFDQDYLANNTATTISVTVPSEMNNTIINNLQPFTMYSVVVTAENEFGSSLPSTRIRALTLENAITNTNSIAVIPKLPDVRECCISQGVTHRTCLDKMCDPIKADFTEVPDLMVCAPWANITFTCLANNIDHTPCCKARGLPETCLQFCDGTVKSIDFNLFKCLQYMSDYTSCLLQGYGVLPGPPQRLKAPMIAGHYAILEWQPPKVLADTVKSYHLNIRELGSGNEYTVIEKSTPPIILEQLEANTYYESFIVAANVHGKSGPSPRLIFQTKPEVESDPITPMYNMTTCCRHSGLLPQCMNLCTYDIKMSDFQKSGRDCQSQVSTILRCGAGGRNHETCCNRRGVTKKCMPMCRGVMVQQPAECLSYAGNIIQCFEEGTGNIPGPVENLHATSVTNTSISLSWTPFENDTASEDVQFTNFVVQYGKVNNMTMYETINKLESEVNTTDTELDLNDLMPNALYRILVVARGKFGSSLPSAMLLINTSKTNADSLVFGAPSPPHSLTVSSHSATFITVSWQPPEFSSPHEKLHYRLFHKNGNNFTIVDTKMLLVRLVKLPPNSQHIIYLTAIGSKGTSLPSETLVAWTDPALPAFVDPPTIHPTDFISEGGTMTILCLALGNPMPMISLYVGGMLVRQETSRHMVTSIHNITTDMQHISCYADNGFGVPMQSTKKISINFAPRIQASGIQVASVGETVELKCTIKSKPIPKTMFWRDLDGRVPVINSGNYDMTMMNDVEDPTTYTMLLKIIKLNPLDVGDYFCHAENVLGSATRPVSVRIRNSPSVSNITQCCQQQNVSSSCIEACSVYLDIESVIDRPECLQDFSKLMKCAADGSDHRGCCAAHDVSRRCLNLCRGEAAPNSGTANCALQYTKTIVGCFQENQNRLPGPPHNLMLQKISDDGVLIKWEPPIKNPKTVEGYRIFWHSLDVPTDINNITSAINGLGTTKLEAHETSITIDGLKHGIMYELVVKAGNHFGASVLSDPLRFTLDDQTATSSHTSSNAGIVSGILAGFVAICLIIAAFMFFRNKKIYCKNANGGVAFENPSYLKETNNVEQVHIQTISNQQSQELEVPASSGLHQNGITSATEVNPTLYEEFKLGSERGFKKLVS